MRPAFLRSLAATLVLAALQASADPIRVDYQLDPAASWAGICAGLLFQNPECLPHPLPATAPPPTGVGLDLKFPLSGTIGIVVDSATSTVSIDASGVVWELPVLPPYFSGPAPLQDQVPMQTFAGVSGPGGTATFSLPGPLTFTENVTLRPDSGGIVLEGEYYVCCETQATEWRLFATPIPEPSVALSTALGLAALAARRRGRLCLPKTRSTESLEDSRTPATPAGQWVRPSARSC